MSFYDIVVVGSGFGGAVMAARLGAHVAAHMPGRKVLVLEKGQDHCGELDPESDGGPLNAQGNRHRHTLAPEHLARMAEVFTDSAGAFRSGVASMSVVAGKGFGGGSNVYDGVSLRAPTEAFEQVRAERRLWPEVWSRASLEPYYALVEDALRVCRLRWTDAAVPHWQLATKRDFVFAEGCRRIGATAAPLKVADAADANEGWWNEGPRFAGRQSLSKNYLAQAAAAGVELRSGCEVDEIAPSGDGYVVSGTDHRGGEDKDFEIECRLLVVAAGAVTSTGLLLRSAHRFDSDRQLDPGQVLGKHLSGNGDYGVTGVVGQDYELAVEGHKGKPMSSFCPTFWKQHRFILIPFYAAPLYLALGQPSTILRAADPEAVGRACTEVAPGPDGRPERAYGLAYKQRLTQFGPKMLTMGCLALDTCEGEVRLGSGAGRYEVAWRETDATTEARWNTAVSTMRKIYQALGGEMYLDAYRAEGTVSTAHPLGGCRMAERQSDVYGVVDPFGESFENRNLFVVDGAIIPSALGVNPSLTIAALAEAIAARLIAGEGTEPLASRLG
jgi:choline dehydrogenase-like flavoprotein